MFSKIREMDRLWKCIIGVSLALAILDGLATGHVFSIFKTVYEEPFEVIVLAVFGGCFLDLCLRVNDKLDI